MSYSSASGVRFTRNVCLQIKSCVFPIPFVCFTQVSVKFTYLFQLNTLKITKFNLKTFILLNTKTTPRHLLFFLYKDLYFTPLIRIIWNHLSKRAYLFWIVNNKLEFVFTVVWRRQLPYKGSVNQGLALQTKKIALCVSQIDHQIEMTCLSLKPLSWRIMPWEAKFNEPVIM